MKPKTVGYSESHETVSPMGLKTWVKNWYEVELDSGDSPDECHEHCKMKVQSWNANHQSYEFNGETYFKHKDMPNMPPFAPLTGSSTVQNPIDYKLRERLEKLIDDAQNISELDMYYGDIVKHGMLEEYQTKKQALSPLPKQR